MAAHILSQIFMKDICQEWCSYAAAEFGHMHSPHENWPSEAHHCPPPVAEAHWGCWLAGPPHYSLGSSRRRSWGCCGFSASLSWHRTGMLQRERQAAAVCSHVSATWRLKHAAAPRVLTAGYPNAGSYSKGLLFNMGLLVGQPVDGVQSCWLDRIPLTSAQWVLLAH